MQNAWKPSLCTKINKKPRVERSFLAKKRFLVNFWSPPGSPGGFRDDLGNCQNRSFLSFMVNCERKRRWTASGRPREGSRGASRRPQRTILRRFMDPFCTSKTNEKTQKVFKIIQKILKNSWLWLGRPWTFEPWTIRKGVFFYNSFPKFWPPNRTTAPATQERKVCNCKSDIFLTWNSKETCKDSFCQGRRNHFHKGKSLRLKNPMSDFYEFLYDFRTESNYQSEVTCSIEKRTQVPGIH